MKIRILTQNPFSVGFGGVEQQASKYIENIKSLVQNIDIGFFDWSEKAFDILHIVGIHTCINPYWIDVLKKNGVKIVVSSIFYVKPNYLFDFRRPLVYKLFSFFPYHIVNWMKQLCNKADLILPNSYYELQQLVEVFGVNKSKLKVLYNGVDKNYFDFIDKDLFKKTYNLNNYILSVSHIEPRKNHLNLIKGFLEFKKCQDEMLSHLNISHYVHTQQPALSDNDLKLVLIGDYRGNYFDYHNAVKKLIAGNQDIIHLNNCKNTDALFKSAYLGSMGHFLLSSLETPGLSNIEAGLAGNKIILGDCEPVKEYFKNFAKYINPKSVMSIKKEIAVLIYERLLENTSIKKEDIGKEHRQKQQDFVKANYTWEKIGKQLLNHYLSLGEKE